MSTWGVGRLCKTDQEKNPRKWLIAVVQGLRISQVENAKENFKYENEQKQQKKPTLAHFFLNKQANKKLQ